MKRNGICVLVTIVLLYLPLQAEISVEEIKQASAEHQFLNKERLQFLFSYWGLDDSVKAELHQFPQRPTLDEECDTMALTPWLKYEGVDRIIKCWVEIDSTKSGPWERVLKTTIFRDTVYVHQVPE